MSNFDIFVSYPREENERPTMIWRESGIEGSIKHIGWVDYFQRRFCSELSLSTATAWRVFFDQDSIHVGAVLGKTIEKALESAKVMICIVSPFYLKSDWCRREREHFLNHHKENAYLIPIVIRGKNLDQLPIDLKDRLIGLEFCTKDNDSPLNPDDSKDCKRKFKSELSRLISAAKNQLEKYEPEEEEYDPNWSKVYLAPAQSDMADEWSDIRKELADSKIAAFPQRLFTELNTQIEISDALDVLPGDFKGIVHIISPNGGIKNDEFEEGIDNFVDQQLNKISDGIPVLDWQSHQKAIEGRVRFKSPTLPRSKTAFTDYVTNFIHKPPVPSTEYVSEDIFIDKFNVDETVLKTIKNVINEFKCFGKNVDEWTDKEDFISCVDDCAAMITVYGPTKSKMDQRTRVIKKLLSKDRQYLAQNRDFGLYLEADKDFGDLDATIAHWATNKFESEDQLRGFLNLVKQHIEERKSGSVK